MTGNVRRNAYKQHKIKIVSIGYKRLQGDEIMRKSAPSTFTNLDSEGRLRLLFWTAEALGRL